MMENILALARKNVTENTQHLSIEAYLNATIEEVEEVRMEIKKDNHIYLTDELADVLWTISNVLAICEKTGLIESVEDVFVQGEEKYTERFLAMRSGRQEQWNIIKKKQKDLLYKKHQQYYDDSK